MKNVEMAFENSNLVIKALICMNRGDSPRFIHYDYFSTISINHFFSLSVKYSILEGRNQRNVKICKLLVLLKLVRSYKNN